MRALPWLLVSLLLVGCVASGNVLPQGSAPTGTAQAAVPSDAIHEGGYLAVRDGTMLHYDIIRPNTTAPVPTLFTYDGYDAGSNVDPSYAAQFVPEGYAMVGVNVRGTGCSGGHLDFFEPVEGTDGYDAIQWIANQSWSNGKVAMIGKSYPGITQLFVAATQPPHLVAAAPGHMYGDIYRDVAYPGGIFNYAFAGLWSFIAQPEPGYAAAIQSKDPTCEQNMLEHTATNAQFNAFLQAQEHMFDDALIKERSPIYVADKIQVPLYLFQSWQDEQVGVRGVNLVEHLNTTWYLTLSNGDHGMYRTKTSLERLDRFFAHYVKGVDNGFENEPRVTVWWDASTATRAPAWVTTYPTWPVTNVTPLVLHPGAGGALAPEPGTGMPDAFAYGVPGTSNGAGYGETQGVQSPLDQVPDAPAGTRVVYTSAPLANDTVVLGPANLTFWLASTAPDTDIMVALNEVRPDGKVVYVQKGWLRASHRELDLANTTMYRPYQTHTHLDLLTPGTPVEMNVEIFALGQAFRAGSRIQIAVESPSVVPELWGSAPLPAPAVDLVYHDADHPATLTLPVLPGQQAGVPLPACGSLIRQTCR